MDLTRPINSIIRSMIPEKQDEIIRILETYFLVTIDSYKYKFNSGIKTQGEFQVSSQITLQNKRTTYKFYTTQIPNLDISFDITNPFEDFQEQMSSLLEFQNTFPLLKDYQTIMYRYFVYPNVNLGVSYDSLQVSFKLPLHVRFYGINLVSQFIRSFLLEQQMVTSSNEKPRPKQQENVQDVNQNIMNFLDQSFSWFDTGVVNKLTNVRSLKIQDYQYVIKVGKIFTVPLQGLNDISFTYSNLIKLDSQLVPEIVDVSLNFVLLYPVEIQKVLG